MAKNFTDKELMMLGKELKEAKDKIMYKWGLKLYEIQVITGMPSTELARVLGDGVKANKTEK